VFSRNCYKLRNFHITPPLAQIRGRLGWIFCKADKLKTNLEANKPVMCPSHCCPVRVTSTSRQSHLKVFRVRVEWGKLCSLAKLCPQKFSSSPRE